MVKEIKVLVNVDIKNNNISINCEADKDLRIADCIRVFGSLEEQFSNQLKEYCFKHPDINSMQDADFVKIKDLKE